MEDLGQELKELKKRLNKLEKRIVTAGSGAKPSEPAAAHGMCRVPILLERDLPPGLSPERAELIRVVSKKWVNGTELKYAFLDQPSDFQGAEDQKQVVRDAFAHWKSKGIGLEFTEVADPSQAEIRIGFKRGDGAWSYVGRDIIDIGLGANERTMNFGWDLGGQDGFDTALHEIGHTLGFPHEHQNPNAGIEWEEEAVYRWLGGPPNNWSRQQTFHNVIRKLDPASVEGSNWDPDSVMHYPFPPGMIRRPTALFDSGLTPAGDLSQEDTDTVRFFYPPLQPQLPQLQPLQSVILQLAAGQQADFEIHPGQDRRYHIRTFGYSDTVMVLFEEVNGQLKRVGADDDGGTDYNAKLHLRLNAGVKYVVRIRLYYQSASGQCAVMYW